MVVRWNSIVADPSVEVRRSGLLLCIFHDISVMKSEIPGGNAAVPRMEFRRRRASSTRPMLDPISAIPPGSTTPSPCPFHCRDQGAPSQSEGEATKGSRLLTRHLRHEVRDSYEQRRGPSDGVSPPSSCEQHATDARTLDLGYPSGVDNTEPAPTPLSASAHIRQQQESRVCGRDDLEARSREPDRDEMG